MDPLVKVYLFTYNRNQLLRRALKSLIDQSFTDWCCELHNDNPNDTIPGQIVDEFNDSRVTVINHPVNLGPTASFNLAYQKVQNKYVSVLEDDNWWDLDFLSHMVDVMEKNPDVFVSWSSMRFWQERADGTWKDLNRKTWSLEQRPFLKFNHLTIQQLHAAVHSNGAMLVRSTNIQNYVIPGTTWFDFVESIRERVFDYPILLVNKPLANYALTITTSREKKLAMWNAWQIILSGSLLNCYSPTRVEIKSFWSFVNRTNPILSIYYFFSVFYYPKIWRIILHAPVKNWFYGVGYHLRHPRLLVRTLREIKAKEEVRRFIESNTSQRVKDSGGEFQTLQVK